MFTRFFYDLTFWPNFLTWHDPYLNLTEILSRWLFWESLMKIGNKLWSLKCSQGFSMIWPTNLVLGPTWSIFDLDQVWWRLDQTMVSKVFTRFFYDLTYWPNFWPNMIHIRSWPSLMKIGPKLWPLKCSQGFFFMIWLLTKFLTWDNPYSILTKLEEDWTKTVASRVFTRFFYDLTYWPSFWPDMTHTQSWLSLIKIGPKLWPLECSQGFF